MTTKRQHLIAAVSNLMAAGHSLQVLNRDHNGNFDLKKWQAAENALLELLDIPANTHSLEVMQLTCNACWLNQAALNLTDHTNCAPAPKSYATVR